MNQGKCTTRREYKVLSHDPKCDANSEYYYPVGKCVPKCEIGEIRRGNECVEDEYPCRQGTVLHQCKLRCMEPEPMRFRKKRVMMGRLPLTKEEKNRNARKTRCKRLNGKPGGPAYVFSDIDGSCAKKCDEEKGYVRFKKRCRKKKEVVQTVRKRPSRSKTTSKRISVGEKRRDSIGKEKIQIPNPMASSNRSPINLITPRSENMEKKQASPINLITPRSEKMEKKQASPINLISTGSEKVEEASPINLITPISEKVEEGKINKVAKFTGNDFVDLTGDNNTIVKSVKPTGMIKKDVTFMDLTGDNNLMDMTGDDDEVDTNHVLIDLTDEVSTQTIEMRDGESVKDYLLRARFVKNNPNMVYGGTSFNKIMAMKATKEKYDIRCNDGTLLGLKSLQTLEKNTWLNDEIINNYFRLLHERDIKLCGIYKNRRKPSYYLSTFFLPTLLSVTDVKMDGKNDNYDFSRIKKKILDLMPFMEQLDIIYIPINVNSNHWILGVIFVESKMVMMFDSLYDGQTNKKNNLLRIGGYLMRWYSDMVNYQRGGPLDGWKIAVYSGNIRQNNGYDCGMYVIMTADFLSDDLLLPDMGANFAVPGVENFFRGADDLNSFRIKIGYDIMCGELDYPLLSWNM
jgi:hypothetical protein